MVYDFARIYIYQYHYIQYQYLMYSCTNLNRADNPAFYPSDLLISLIEVLISLAKYFILYRRFQILIILLF